MVGPVLEIAEEHSDIKVGKINVDEEQELAAQFQIMSIPTLMVVKDGKITEKPWVRDRKHRFSRCSKQRTADISLFNLWKEQIKMKQTDFVVTLFEGKENLNNLTVAVVMGVNALKQGHSASIILMVEAVALGQPGAVQVWISERLSP